MNRIMTFKGVNTNTFAPFPTSGATYAVYSPINDQQQQAVKRRKEKKVHAIGYSIGVSTLAIGVLAAILAKGMPKGFYKKADEILKNFEQKRKQLIADDKNGLYLKALNGLKVAGERAKAIFNIGPLKDVFLKHWAYKTKLTKTIFDGITSGFEWVAKKTSNNAYRTTEKRLDRMFKIFTDSHSSIPKEKLNEMVEINGVKKTVKQWLQELHSDIKNGYNNGFDSSARAQRTKKLEEVLEGVSKIVYARTFGHIHGFNIKQLFENKGIRESLISDLTKLWEEKDLRQCFISEKWAEPARKAHTEKIEDIKKPIIETLEKQLLPLYKKILPETEYEKVDAAGKRTIKAFNHSVKVETEKLFDKIRDLKIGCAPLDAGMLSLALAIIGIKLAKADNNDERKSIGLLYGIPALGTIVTISYCTAALVSGGHAIMLGLIAGALIHKAGEVADNIRKERNENKAQIAQQQQQQAIEIGGV